MCVCMLIFLVIYYSAICLFCIYCNSDYVFVNGVMGYYSSGQKKKKCDFIVTRVCFYAAFSLIQNIFYYYYFCLLCLWGIYYLLHVCASWRSDSFFPTEGCVCVCV